MNFKSSDVVLLLILKVTDLPLELLEIVLMRTFVMLYARDYVGDDDDSCPYRPGKSSSSERRAFTLLSLVCSCWWQTLSGWPQSPTAHWVKHKLMKLIKRKCMKLNRNSVITQCSVG